MEYTACNDKDTVTCKCVERLITSDITDDPDLPRLSNVLAGTKGTEVGGEFPNELEWKDETLIKDEPSIKCWSEDIV